MGKILIVEDMPDALGSYEMALRLDGHSVVGVTEGEMAAGVYAVAFDSAIPFNLVLCDIALGGINGFDVAQQIREKDEHAPIVFLTAFDDPLSVGRAEAVGNSGYWSKPLTASALREKVREFLLGGSVKP